MAGWVRTKRESKEFAFIEINDGSCLANLQVIVDASTAGYALLGEIGTGTAIAAHGELVESPGKGQRWELKADSLQSEIWPAMIVITMLFMCVEMALATSKAMLPQKPPVRPAAPRAPGPPRREEVAA